MNQYVHLQPCAGGDSEKRRGWGLDMQCIPADLCGDTTLYEPIDFRLLYRRCKLPRNRIPDVTCRNQEDRDRDNDSHHASRIILAPSCTSLFRVGVVYAYISSPNPQLLNGLYLPNNPPNTAPNLIPRAPTLSTAGLTSK
jgi:hypothetical protein